MDYRIIVDSCCDLTQELKKKLGIITVPLTLRLGETEYLDDERLDMRGFMADMKACVSKVGSAAPSPAQFSEAIERAKQAFVITLSGKLSGTYNSAMTGKRNAEEEGCVHAHVFDTKSASAGEALAAIKLSDMIRQGLSRDEIISAAGRFIDGMKTYFVLDSYDNLLKNGRLRRVTETIIRALNIKLIMGADGDGDIALYGKALGSRQVIEKLLYFIQSSGKQTRGENLVISHCNNEETAARLGGAARERFGFSEVFILPTGGVSSLYADDKGVVMAF